jgi:DNA-binding NarL/FixJ family response regulator
MTRTLTIDSEPGPPVSFDASGVAAIGTGPRRHLVAEILESLGCDVAIHDDAGDFVADGGDAALAVLVEVSLVDAGRDLKLLGSGDTAPAAIVVCNTIRPGEVRLALSAGVAGVVHSTSLRSTLAPCVAAVMSGQVCVPKPQARQVDAASLSPRERQILGLVVMGCMNSEIADRLVVAESTVKSHLSSAFAKLGVRSRHEAVDLILDSERGLGMGILRIGGEPIEVAGSASG